jgi:hypothetical protein
VRYYAVDNAARSITISAKMVPSIVHIVLEAELYSSSGTGTSATTSKIGYAQIDIPKATLTGSFTIKMTPDGVASTPFAARALANESTAGGCTSDPYYATIKEIISAANWWDNVVGIAIEGGDFSQTRVTSGTQLHVWAVPNTGLPFRCPYGTTGGSGLSGYMTFSSDTTSVATIAPDTGVISGVTGGTSLLHAVITGNTGIEASALLTLT